MGDISGRRRDAGLIKQVEMIGTVARACEAMHEVEQAFLDQRGFQRAANAARRTDDDGGAFAGTAHDRVKRQRSGALSSASKR